MVHCAIWYQLYDFKNVKNTHGGVLLLVNEFRSVTLIKVTLALKIVTLTLKIVQIVPNGVKHHK